MNFRPLLLGTEVKKNMKTKPLLIFRLPPFNTSRFEHFNSSRTFPGSSYRTCGNGKGRSVLLLSVYQKSRGISPEAGAGEHKTRISQPLPPCEFSPPSFRYRSKTNKHNNKATFEFQAAPFQHINILTFQQF